MRLRLVRCFKCHAQYASKQSLQLAKFPNGKEHLVCSNCAKVLSYPEQFKNACQQAETRANQEKVTVYVVRTQAGLYVRTQAEIYTYHLTDSLLVEYTAEVKEWHLEIRNDRGNEEGTDHFTGTERGAIEDARKWLAEALTLETYQQEILVVAMVDGLPYGECVYQGTFDMTPESVRAQA